MLIFFFPITASILFIGIPKAFNIIYDVDVACWLLHPMWRNEEDR